MRSLNETNIIGNIGKKPELKHTSNDKPYTRFSVACNYRYKDQDGEYKRGVDWISIIAWERLAERAVAYLDAGSKVYVKCRLKPRTWENHATNQKRYSLDVVATEILFLDPHQNQASEPEPVAREATHNEQTPEITPEDAPF